MTFEKRRAEAATYEVGFLQRLNTGESLVTPSVRVERAVLYEWVDVSAEILDSDSPAVVGTSIQFKLVAASPDSDLLIQQPGTYRVVLTVATSQSEVLEGIIPLTVAG